MREIKFRGLTPDGIWVYGFLYQDETGAYIKDGAKNKRFGTGIDVERESIGQYTGLKDKNGKEIYEGDIVQNIADDGMKFSKFEIFWCDNNCAFMKRREDGEKFQLEKQQRFLTVIGNIYENPELLK